MIEHEVQFPNHTEQEPIELVGLQVARHVSLVTGPFVMVHRTVNYVLLVTYVQLVVRLPSLVY
jgi:hypothetical protein